MINLQNFEGYIDPIIYLRGLDYFRQGKVKYVQENDEQMYSARVEGTKTYDVEVELDDDMNILDSDCTCPYDYGEFCKHQVAVFLEIRKARGIPSTTGDGPDTFCTHEGAKRRELFDRNEQSPDLSEILTARSKEELVDFLVEIANDYEEVKLRAELLFNQWDEKEERLKSIGLMKDYIRMNADRSGFVSYSAAPRAVEGAELVLQQAKQASHRGKHTHAVNLVICVIREMVNLLTRADDSDGFIGSTVDYGFGVIEDILVEGDLNGLEKQQVCKELMSEASRKLYEDWADWQLAFYEMCARTAFSPELREKVEQALRAYLDKKDGESRIHQFYNEKVNQIRYTMIRQYDGDERAQEFISQHLQYPSFRKMKIERAMEEKDYDSVIQLALDGEKNNTGRASLRDVWREYRYAAYVRSGNISEQRNLARDFVLDGSFQYYLELKSTYPREQWKDFYPEIIQQFVQQKLHFRHQYAKILLEEREMEKLSEYVQRIPEEVETFYPYLLPEFFEAVYAAFKKLIEMIAENAGGRKDYQRIGNLIRKLKSAGGTELAEEIKEDLLIRYRRRPALKDELTRV